MKPGPDVIQPQPQLISGPCNTPPETKRPDWVSRAETARWRDGIHGAAGPGESAEGKIRVGGLQQGLGLSEEAEVIHCSAVKA